MSIETKLKRQEQRIQEFHDLAKHHEQLATQARKDARKASRDYLRLKLKTLIGKKKVLRRADANVRESLRGKPMKLLEVNRTRCLVEIDGESWWCPIENIRTDDDDNATCFAVGMLFR